MIVYVESNFVLELAFLQEAYERCLELLRLAESQDIHLVLPAFSIGEPYEVWVRRSKQRRALRDQLSTAIRQKKVSGSVPPLDRYLSLQRLLLCRKEYNQFMLLAFFLARLASTYELLEWYLGIKRFESALFVLKTPWVLCGCTEQDPADRGRRAFLVRPRRVQGLPRLALRPCTRTDPQHRGRRVRRAPAG